MNLYQKMQTLLDDRNSIGQLRSIVSKKQIGNYIYLDGEKYLNLSSNDYLGLACDTKLTEEFLSTVSPKTIRLSSSGSPLLTGAQESYAKAQSKLEQLFSKKALFFNSGFAANSGVIAALATKDTLILADKLAHASIINGMQNAQGKALRFAHNDYEHLEKLITQYYEEYDQIIVVTEAIFSMDGDKCDLDKLVALKKRFDKVYLYVDEAHSFGLYNDNGAGLCASLGYVKDVDFILTTFGKALGSQGAALICNEVAREYFINVTRELIFSTALSPLSFEHNAFMLDYVQKCQDRRQRLNKICEYLHQEITEAGLLNMSSSQIIPLLTFTNEKALLAYEFFKHRKIYAMPIRHPTVPKGRARLRLSITASLSDLQVEEISSAIKALKLD